MSCNMHCFSQKLPPSQCKSSPCMQHACSQVAHRAAPGPHRDMLLHLTLPHASKMGPTRAAVHACLSVGASN